MHDLNGVQKKSWPAITSSGGRTAFLHKRYKNVVSE